MNRSSASNLVTEQRPSKKPVKNWRYYISLLLRKLWGSAAVLLVSLAVIMSVLRYSLPYMDSQKHYLESWLFDEYGTEVKIGYISAMWKGKGPAIVLKDLTIGDTPNSPISLLVDETQIEIDFWASVQQRQIQSQRFNLIGLSLDVDIPRIQGGGDEDFPILDALQTLFLEQLERFSVSDSEVLLRNRVAEQKFQIQQLSWLNDGQRHQGVGQMRVAELARNSARIILDLNGTPDNFTGTFFAEAEDLDLAPWIKAVLPTEYELQRSRGNFKFWAGLDNARLTHVQAHLAESQFAWQSNPENEQSRQYINADIMKGDLYATPGNSGWNFNIDDLTLIINEKVFSSSWHGALTQNRELLIGAQNELNLAPLLPLIGVVLGETVDAELLALEPQIRVEEASFYLSSEHQGAKLSFSDLSIAETSKNPGINAFAGEVFWLDSQAYFSISSIHNYLVSEDSLGYLLPYDALNIDAHLNMSGDKPYLYVPNFTLNNSDLSISQSFSYDFNSHFLSAQLRLQDSNTEVLKGYFPDLMGMETRAWLKRALKQGDTSEANVLWQGKLTSFPFNDGEGIFQAGVRINDLTLQYQKDWPVLEQATVYLLFENESLFIQDATGEIAGVSLSNAGATIPVLGDGAHIEIDAVGKGTGEQLTSLFQQSSLQDSVGNALEYAKISGEMIADVNLYVPFNGEELVAKAGVYFSGNAIEIPKLNLQLTDLKGVLQVNNDVLTAKGVSANLLGQEITLSADSAQKQEGYSADISFTGDWNIQKLIAPFHQQLANYVEGQSSWSGQLGLLFPEEGYNYSLLINSHLDGISSTLPVPARKAPEEKLPFFLDSEGDQKASTVRVLLGRDIKFNGILPHDTAEFSRAHMSVGGDNFVGMGLGFSISADLEYLDYSHWHTFLGDLVQGLPESENPIISAPQRIFIESQNLDIAGKRFNNVDVLAKNRDVLWEVQINADEARADAVLYKDWLEKGVEINADFIRLQPEELVQTIQNRTPTENTGLSTSTVNSQNLASTQMAVTFNRRSFPPLKFTCEQCGFDGYDVGKIRIEASRSRQGMHIDTFRVQMRDGTVNASGDWFFGESGNSTRMQGTFDSDDFGAFLKAFNFDSGIRDSDANMEFDLSWQDTPYAFEKSSLAGSIDWRLGDGYLTEISDNGARLLSVLSLESLLRKLRLDFRDVFAKGFFFDNMQGTFQLTDGMVNTKDTIIDGGAAGVSISGNTDLVNNELNYLVNVNPKLTSSLPVLIAWMVNPATAVAALAFDEVLTSANVVSGIQYSLTGSLKEPQITLLEQTSKVVELPAQNRLPGKGSGNQPVPSPGETDKLMPEGDPAINPQLYQAPYIRPIVKGSDGSEEKEKT